MRKKLMAGVLSVGMVAGGLAMASPAQAGPCNDNNWFCLWDHINYDGERLLGGSWGDGAKVYPSRSDAASSGKNFTSLKHCGQNKRTGLPDERVHMWSAGDYTANLHDSSDGDKIDHVDVGC